ncbi:MAG: PAS domain S-box protein [Syntrophobacteraceae bacterium]
MCPEPVEKISGTVSRAQEAGRDKRLDLEFFRRCFNEFPDPVVVADSRGMAAFLNNAAQSLTGCSAGEDAPLFLSEFLRADAEDIQGPLIEGLLSGKSSSAVRVLVRGHAGDWLPFSLSAQTAIDGNGEPSGFVAILREVPTVPSKSENNILGQIFSSVISNFPLAFFTVDTDLRITYMNEHLERLTGYRAAEVVNRMTCAELLRTPHCHTDECLVRQAMEKRIHIAGVRRFVIDREGRNIPVAVHCSMITDAENRVIGGFKAMRDITPLFEAEQKIRMVVEITQEGILMLDENDRVIYANSKMAEIFEQPKDELIGQDVKEILPFQHLDITRELVQKVHTETFQQVRFCSTIKPAGGEQREDRVFETSIVVARVGQSLITCMYFHDLTKHIEIERQLFSANSFLQNIIMSSADGIVVADTKGKVLIFNDSAERILGYNAKEILADPKGLFKVASPELTRDIMRRLRNGGYGPPGKLTSTRINLIRKDGEQVPVNFSAAIIKKEDREIGTVGIFSDLREHLKIRRELEDAKVQLMQAEKIASVGRLAAGVAHEINNPLSGILIYADMLSKDLAHNPQWSEDLEEIINQTLRCKQIVTRLLDFSRQSAGQRVAYDINTVINRSVELLGHQALFHDVEFVLELDPSIPWMMGDPSQLQQVFTNLIINAGTAMRGKGKITVTSRFDPASEQVVLQFWDTGPGIKSDIVDKLFDPFFTTKPPGEGTGLGLSVAYGIIQQHGGSIEGANAPSGGALFTLILPLEGPEKTIEFS